jgi:diadenosine tetraphosphatase ApaH/serine/threonine PP2A family protein phosphatase
LPPQYLPMIEWVGAQMTGDQSAAVRAWPKTLRVAIPGVGDALFCHATPRDENEIFSRLTPDDLLQPVFDTLDCALVVCGHTHMPFVRTIGRTRVVNAGSVGMPFGGDTAAQWLLIEGSDSTLGAPAIEPRRTPYDVNAAADTIRATRCPLADEFFVRNLINPPAEQQMLDAFTFASFGRRTD